MHFSTLLRIRSKKHLAVQRGLSTALGVAGCFGLITLSAGAQSVDLSAGTTRDAAAIQLLTGALNASGGMAVWQSIHGAKVTGSLTAQVMTKFGTKPLTNTIVWVDDWSTGHHRYSRTATNANGGSRVLKHGDKDTFKANFQGKEHTVTFDSANILLTHLPGAALAKVLDDKSYSIAVHINASDLDHDEVLVSKLNSNMGEIWYLSKKTGLVDAVRYTVPATMNTFQYASEIAVYKHYRTEFGRTFPDEVKVMRPNNPPVTFTFQTLEINPGVSAADFADAGAQ